MLASIWMALRLDSKRGSSKDRSSSLQSTLGRPSTLPTVPPGCTPGVDRGGPFARCVTIPDEDLFHYVLHRHCLLRVCYGGVGLAKKSHWQSRLVLVLVSLLWSLAANSLVSAIILPRWDRVGQVIAITLLT